jgi:uncharacterized protein (DUF362 family)
MIPCGERILQPIFPVHPVGVVIVHAVNQYIVDLSFQEFCKPFCSREHRGDHGICPDTGFVQGIGCRIRLAIDVVSTGERTGVYNTSTDDVIFMKPVFVQGLTEGTGSTSLESGIGNVLLQATDNLAWLNEGDVVLLKPALNSGDPYPSTTHPFALEVTARVLSAHGADVVIGDQSGMEHVVHGPAGVVRGNTHDNYLRSGMARGNRTKFVKFEGEGWDEGFFHYASPETQSWKQGFFITSWIKKADHIISLPRISTHSQAGITLGMKIMVGLLREDSRLEFHANGPYNGFIVRYSQGSDLPSEDDGSGKFFEKIVEISDAIKKKLRATLFVGTEAQVTFGPNRYAYRVGNLGIGKAYRVKPEPGMVFASADQVAAEAFAFAVLKDLKRSVPRVPRYKEKILLFQNRLIRDVMDVRVRDHPFIRHAEAIGLGSMPGEIVFTGVPAPVRERISPYLA